MALVLHHGVDDETPCAYLPGRFARMEQRVMVNVSSAEADALLDRGWRHFGPMWFRPVCEGCQACVSVRLDVKTFVPDRSQARALKKAQRLRKELSVPVVDDGRLALFHAWHAQREGTRGWKAEGLDERSYALQFAFPCVTAREVAYYDDEAGGKLVMVGICDESPRGYSAIYCFHDPAYARWSLGTGNIMTLIELSQRLGLPYVYLGYAVAECQSLRYKGNYRPQETLVGIIPDDGEPEWNVRK
jgi:arginine-tRNA-protein transferase